MLARSLGRTGMSVSPIGFGSVKLGRNQKTQYGDFAIPTDRQAERLLWGILDLGINLIDTAPAYGQSESRIGRILSSRRKEFILSTKVGERFEQGQSHYDFSAVSIRQSVSDSLRRLRTDYLDIVLVHSHGRDHEILEQSDVVETLQALRAEGCIRAIGFSGNIPEQELRCLDWADVMMITYHLEDPTRLELLQQAKSQGVGVLIKKGLDSGRLAPSQAIPPILANRCVESLIVGGINLEHFQENCRLAGETIKLVADPPSANTPPIS